MLELITGTQLIRQAALLTKSVELKPGKILTYNDPELTQVEDAVCWLCGGQIKDGLGMPTKKRIGDTFTDHPYARAHESRSLCPGCVFCLSMRELRNYSVLATLQGISHPGRAEWREILLSPPEPPFVACLAVSGQKHLTFKAPVNYSREAFVVLLEEQAVEVVPDKLREVLTITEELYLYFTKDEIESGQYSQHRIQECGISKWEEIENKIRRWRRTRLFNLALFVAQRGEKPEKAAQPVRKAGKSNAKRVSPTVISGNKAGNTEPAQLGLNW